LPALAADVPNPTLTPGVARSEITAGYCAVDQGCEVDHLISLEIGGANDRANLWPQPYSGTVWNAHVMDRLENKLHTLVCAGAVTLEDAQRETAANWIAVYRKYLGDP
jgi:hypothetical protein